MLGAIAGDIIGSVYERHNLKSKEFVLFSPAARFTDDSVLTVALAEAIMDNADFGLVMKRYCRRYPKVGYGASFKRWAQAAESRPYNSWGNGAAMRTSSVGYAFATLDEVLQQAEFYASFTHNHPEGVKGAQATAAAIFLARNGAAKDEIKSYTTSRFRYDLARTLDEIRPAYTFDVSCQGTVPQALTAFLESQDYEDAVRNAISLGGDSDTLACITGAVAEAFYGKVPDSVAAGVRKILDEELWQTVARFHAIYTPIEKSRLL
ncbi:MAG: ADP-ribosylglycohydrolase family protein [Deltaproteobacteria bacterium]|nr:ADP-ribosylglycohydrolase family protein [Deltaproteobacteria bacterium]